MKFSLQEKKDLLKGWAAVSLAFGIVLSDNYKSFEFLQNILIAALAVGLGFILHELSHKYFAQKYHCWAEFRSFDIMLLLAIGMSFFGFVFAAPGAVMIQGYTTKKQNGIISAAGPMTNILLGAVCLPLYFLTQGFVQHLFFYAFSINAWLAIFNLIPFGFFDGKKIFTWNKLAWGGMVLASVGLFVVSVMRM